MVAGLKFVGEEHQQRHVIVKAQGQEAGDFAKKGKSATRYLQTNKFVGEEHQRRQGARKHCDGLYMYAGYTAAGASFTNIL